LVSRKQVEEGEGYKEVVQTNQSLKMAKVILGEKD
jgi:hypothetical protein